MESHGSRKVFLMRIAKKNLTKRYSEAHRTGKSHLKRRPYLLPIAGLIVGGLIVAGVLFTQKDNPTLRPSDSLVVYLHDKGQSQTLSTKAATVGELVDKLHLNLMEQDVVEPARDTPIVEDNFRINIYRARPVTVVDSGSKIVALTAQKSPRMVAEKAGLVVYPEDIVSFAQGNIEQNIIGEQVLIDRSTPVFLNLYGTPLDTRTQSKTVGDLLKEKNIKVATGDTVRPGTNTPVSANMQIFVIRNGIQLISVEEVVPAPTQTVQDNSLSFGTTVVRQNGSAGKKVITYQVETKDGVEISRKVISEVVVQVPVAKIVATGKAIDISGDKSAVMALAGIAPGDYGYVNYIISRESGWCPTKWQGQPGNCPAYHGVPTSGGYGLGQATPGSKMAGAGADWATNPVTQLKWASGYAIGRFGSWAGAYNFWLSHHYW